MNQSDIKLQIKRFFNCPVEKVYSAWTDPEQLRKWHAPGEVKVDSASADLKIGGRYRIEMIIGPDGQTSTTYGEYKEIVSNKRLVYTWGWEGPDRYETIVTVEFNPKDNGTELVLTHERFSDTDGRDKHQYGWNGCLDKLESFLKN